MSQSSSVRQEYEVVLEPLLSVPLERELPLGQRLWQQGWLRKSLILIVLAVLWELVARYQNNDLLLPTFLQTASALYDGLISGELLSKVGISLVVLLKGYLIGIVLAFALTTLAVSTQLGRDLLSTLTSMFNPLPAIALLPLALLWFGLGQNSLIFVLVHSVLWALALNTYAGFLGVSETLRMAGRNYGLKGIRFVLFYPCSGGAALDSRWPENRLGLCLAHADRSRTGIWCHQRQGWPGLVHLPEPQRAVHRQGICRSGGGDPDWPAGGEPGVRYPGTSHGQALGHAALTTKTGPLQFGVVDEPCEAAIDCGYRIHTRIRLAPVAVDE